MGPRADGSVPGQARRGFEAIGAWLSRNGSSIHGCGKAPHLMRKRSTGATSATPGSALPGMAVRTTTSCAVARGGARRTHRGRPPAFRPRSSQRESAFPWCHAMASADSRASRARRSTPPTASSRCQVFSAGSALLPAPWRAREALQNHCGPCCGARCPRLPAGKIRSAPAPRTGEPKETRERPGPQQSPQDCGRVEEIGACGERGREGRGRFLPQERCGVRIPSAASASTSRRLLARRTCATQSPWITDIRRAWWEPENVPL